METVSDRPSVLIVGTGAMACLLGARLTPHAQVTMLGTWREGLAALGSRGICLETNGATQTAPVRVTSDPAECRDSTSALVLVKSYQTARAARQLKECLAPDGVALTLQNGLGNREALEQALGAGRVAQGVTTCGVTLLGPGHARLGGEGITYLATHPRLAPLAGLLRCAGFQIEETEGVASLVWGKVVVNAAINPITALLRIRNGELLEPARSGAWRVAREAADEATIVARQSGVRLPFESAEAYVAEVARRTAANRSSMLQDVERGRPTEIDAISGAVVAAGERLGVDTPVNRTLWDLVRSLRPQPDGASG
ncbi:MAG: 2-dehydropantoate 2-reductase [Chloroflexota bacterium]